MKYRLVITDYDNTLAATPNPTSKGNLAAIRRLQDKGGFFTVATGRMTSGMLNNLGEVKVNGPIATYQGAVVYDVNKGKNLLHYPISTEVAAELLRGFERDGLPVNIYCNDQIYVAEEYPFIRPYCEVNKVGFTVQPHLSRFIEENKLTPSKILAIITPDLALRLEKEYGDRYKDVLAVTRSSATYLEFNDAKATKGNAVRKIADMLGVPYAEMICCGDSTNDASMLRAAGLGVAMGNAMPELKAIADVVAPPCVEDGVAWVIDNYCLKD